MKIHVLGSAAGGGFPQWNCNCVNCDGVRHGTLEARPRTQSSIAASADGIHWILIDASPDVLSQLRDFPAAQPARALRDTGFVGIVLTDSQVDHTTGLLMLREGAKLHIHCTEPVRDDLTHSNPLFNVLDHYCGVDWQPLRIDETASFRVTGADGLVLRAIPVASMAPPYSPHRHDGHPGDTLAIEVRDERTGGSLLYAPGLRRIEPPVEAALGRVDCAMVDGTFWTEDELIRLEIGDKRAGDMGHLPQSGPGGMLEVLAKFPRVRKVLTHINNTNPILDERSPQRAQLTVAGIEVAYDGMELVL